MRLSRETSESTRDLSETLRTLNAVVQYRCLNLADKCCEFRKMLQHIDRLERNRLDKINAIKDLAEIEKSREQQAEIALHNAIQRARGIRQSSAEKNLKMAKNQTQNAMIKKSSGPTAHKLILSTKAESIQISLKNTSENTHIPSRMTNLFEQMTQRQELAVQLRGQCMKMIKQTLIHSENPRHRESKTMDALRSQQTQIQVASQRLCNYLQTTATAAHVQTALQSNEVSVMYPVYYRLEEAKRYFHQLEKKREALSLCANSSPAMSHDAQGYQDKILRLLRSESDTTDSALLCNIERKRPDGVFQSHQNLVKSLCNRWNDDIGVQKSLQAKKEQTSEVFVAIAIAQSCSDLLQHQTAMSVPNCAQTDSTGRRSDELMLLCRLIDSIVVCNGRKLRSLVRKEV